MKYIFRLQRGAVFVLIISACFFVVGCTTNNTYVIPPAEPEEYIPTEVVLDVPFTAQAPDGNWVEPWLNACEETSIIMIDAYYKEEQQQQLSVEAARERILSVFDIKEQIIGESTDESMDTTARLIDALDMDWHGTVVVNPTVDQMVQEIAAGKPIIVPVYAPDLHSPYYQGGGPDYHVIVVVGYNNDRKEFIVHDPGTESGERIIFSYDTFMNAIHDFTAGEEYTAGAKNILVTEKR